MNAEPSSHGMDPPLHEGGPNDPQTNSESDTILTALSPAETVATSVDSSADTSEDISAAPSASSTPPHPTTSPSKEPVVVIHDEYVPKRPSIWVWRMEIAMCFLSLASFSVSIAVLRVYDGTKLAALPMNITLNAFLSFFTTLARAAFMVPIAEAMSQWKWNMYGSNGHSHTGWPMSDFNTLEQASRGTLGSFRLLLRYRWKHITVFGALVSIMGIATSPVTQQMISYPVLPSPNSELDETRIEVPFARSITKAAFGRLSTPQLTTMADAVRSTFGSSIRFPVEDLEPPCPTGNCTFATYNSLAVCTKVVDITDQLTVTKIVNSSSTQWTNNDNGWLDSVAKNGTTAYNASLPNGLNFITPLSYSFMQVLGGETNETLGFKDQPNLTNFTSLMHAYLIYSTAGNVSYPGYDRTNETDWPFRAAEIIYHMCVNTYQTAVTSGKASTAVIASSDSPLPMENNLPLWDPGCHTDNGVLSVVACLPYSFNDIPGYTYLADPDDPTGLRPENNFTIERSAAVLLAQDLSYVSTIQHVIDDGGSVVGTALDGYFAASIFEALYGHSYNITDPDEQHARVLENANNMARAVTNLIRTSEGNSSAAGTAWTLEAFIHVRWGFMTFFAVQLVFSYVFLAVTIYMTRRGHLPVVKSSALAAILASSEEMRARVGTIDKIQEAEKRAGDVKLRLEGGRFEIV